MHSIGGKSGEHSARFQLLRYAGEFGEMEFLPVEISKISGRVFLDGCSTNAGCAIRDDREHLRCALFSQHRNGYDTVACEVRHRANQGNSSNRTVNSQ